MRDDSVISGRRPESAGVLQLRSPNPGRTAMLSAQLSNSALLHPSLSPYPSIPLGLSLNTKMATQRLSVISYTGVCGVRLRLVAIRSRCWWPSSSRRQALDIAWTRPSSACAFASTIDRYIATTRCYRSSSSNSSKQEVSADRARHLLLQVHHRPLIVNSKAVTVA